MPDTEVKTQKARRPSSMANDDYDDEGREAEKQRLIWIYAQRAKDGQPIFEGGT